MKLLFSALAFGLFLWVSPVQATQVEDDGCEYECPVVHFEWTTSVCPPGYSPWFQLCEKNGAQFDIKPRIVTNHSADVQYEKSQDPHKCHRPSDNTLKDEYGMNNEAKNDFKDDNPEWKESIQIIPEGKVLVDGMCVVPEEPKDYCPTKDGIQKEDEDCPPPTCEELQNCPVTPPVTPPTFSQEREQPDFDYSQGPNGLKGDGLCQIEWNKISGSKKVEIRWATDGTFGNGYKSLKTTDDGAEWIQLLNGNTAKVEIRGRDDKTDWSDDAKVKC